MTARTGVIDPWRLTSFGSTLFLPAVGVLLLADVGSVFTSFFCVKVEELDLLDARDVDAFGVEADGPEELV